MPAPRLSNRAFILILCIGSAFVAYFSAKGVNYLLDPGAAIPARPTVTEVTPEDLARLESGAPAIAPARAAPETPIYYVAAPFADGTVVELTLDADPDYVDPAPEHILKVLVSLHGGIGKTPRMTAPDGKPLSPGRYHLVVRHGSENLIDQTVFVGGAPTAEYDARMTTHHAKLRDWARAEAREIDHVAEAVEKHFRAPARGSLARWLELMRATRAELDRTRKEHVPVFYERGYERLNRILRAADAVEKERDRIAQLKQKDEERERVVGLQIELARAELKALRAAAQAALEEQREPVRFFERRSF